MANLMTNKIAFQPFAEQMQAAGLSDVVVKTFEYYYTQLVQGNTGLISETQIEPVSALPDAEQFTEYGEAGRAALAHTVVLKLNGGLGTSMGLSKAKSLLKVKGELSFLDIIARQILALRQRTGYQVPLILMNSFNTEYDSLQELEKYPALALEGLPLSFVQNKVPKVLQSDFSPVAVQDDLAWCPPGHGDIYTALQSSGLLDSLLAQGYEYVFVSNADNLGAQLDEQILGYFASQKLPFLMEVADRTLADNKGGHLARRTDGRLTLRELAQCPPEELDYFGDISLYSHFNTNNIWLHLPSLRQTLVQNENVLKLPLIRNSKTLDPRDPASPLVYQLETAMGAAIEVFEGAGALRVPRSRFAPVKLCSDLLVLWSDAYLLTEDSRIILNPANIYGLPVVQLDNRYYKFIHQLSERFQYGAPSLTSCQRLEVQGDIGFNQDIKIEDSVRLLNLSGQPVQLDDGQEFKGGQAGLTKTF